MWYKQNKKKTRKKFGGINKNDYLCIAIEK